MTFAVLGLGSNRSFSGLAPLELLVQACVMLKNLFCSDFRVSSVYISRAMYVENQDDFHNMCVCGFTEFSAGELLLEIHKIESSLGRNRANEIRNGPRPLDIDIELFGNEKIDYKNPDDKMKDLQVPHPRLEERAFVLFPLVELLEVLPENAEIQDKSVFKENLLKTGSQGIRKILNSADFDSLMEEEFGAENGRTSCKSSS